LSLARETVQVNPVKVGERPGASTLRANAEPSPGPRRGRCREQTAGTYSRQGHGEGVLQPTNAVMASIAAAAKAEAGRKSLAARHAGSSPASGTIFYTSPFVSKNYFSALA